MKWISVKDKLPKEFDPVLIIRLNKRGQRCRDIGIMDENRLWHAYGVKTKSVTHWMPLPELPKEE